MSDESFRPTFCRICGKQLLRILNRHKYNPKTGESVENCIGYSCPNGPSGHDIWYYDGGYYHGFDISADHV